MPTYSYICEDCGEHFEKVVPYSQNGSEHNCPNGHSRVHRIFSPPAIVFKGSGFYKTDHRPKEKAATD
jgi:putative FmdB family regulatory protein